MVTLHNFRERMYSRRSTHFKDYTKGRLIEEDRLWQQFENRRSETLDNDYHVELLDGILLILRCILSCSDTRDILVLLIPSNWKGKAENGTYNLPISILDSTHQNLMCKFYDMEVILGLFRSRELRHTHMILITAFLNGN